MIRLLLATLCALIYCTPLPASAQPLAEIEITSPSTEWAAINPALSYLRDPTRNLSLEAARAREFTPLERGTADFGYTRDVIWLRFDLHNRLENDEFVLAMRENFLQLYEVFQVDARGQAALIDRQNDRTVFSNRRIAAPELTTPLTLAPGARATLYVRFWSGGSSELSWRVMTTSAYQERSAQRTARNFVFYGMAILLATAAATAWALTRRREFGAYALYALAGLLFVMHADGNTFQYLWPNLPLFNAFASVPLGMGLIIGGLNFARTFLNTPHFHPRLDMVLLGMIVATLAVGASTLVIDAQPIKRLLILFALASTALLALSGVIAARTRFREVRFYIIAWAGAVISAMLMTLRHWFGIEISEDLQHDSLRVVLIFDAVLMGLAIIDRVNWLKQSQQDALEISLAQARRTVALNLRMQDLERQVSIAERLAARQKTQLSQTAHDLRQPLTALRLNLRSVMGEDKDPQTISEVEDTLGYLETLVAQQLSTALSREDGAPVDSAPQTRLGDAMASAVDMFSADASAKGLRLRAVPCTLGTDIPPLDLMRIVTNLVSNAIKATDTGGVLVGVRRGGGLRIEVHDTGSGLPRGVFEAARAAAGKGQPPPLSPGTHGLGLSIVADLAAKNRLRLELLPGPRGGTTLRIWLAPQGGPVRAEDQPTGR